jgi:Cu/Ag efflux protein CusF
MSLQFKAYAVRSGDLWWSSRQNCFGDAPDETSFTPTAAGSTMQRINQKIKKISDHHETLKRIGMQRMIRSVEVAELEQWQNARVIEVAVNVTEKQND